MTWNQPDFVEIPLGMEVTAYANTEQAVASGQGPVVREEAREPAAGTADR